MKKAVIILSLGTILGLHAMDSDTDENRGSLPRRNLAQVWGGLLTEAHLALPEIPVVHVEQEFSSEHFDAEEEMEIEQNN